MRISVVIPAFNAAGGIEETLKGLVRQSRIPDEIIAVDNGSSDDTAEKVKAFIKNNPSLKIILHIEMKKGPAAARNSGVAISSGDVLAFIDADEVPQEDWLSVLEGEFNRGAYAVCGPVSEHDTGNFLKKYLHVMQSAAMGKREIFKADVSNGRFLLAGNFGIKKNLFLQVGQFDENLHIGEDADLTKRIYRYGRPVVYNPKMAVVHNHKETFKGRFRKAFSTGMLQAMFLKNYFERGFYIVFSSRKSPAFTFPFKIKLHPFSILPLLVLIYMISMFDKTIAGFMALFLLMGVTLKVLSMALKSGKKISLFNYIAFVLYWIVERLVFDIGKISGSFRYRVICI